MPVNLPWGRQRRLNPTVQRIESAGISRKKPPRRGRNCIAFVYQVVLSYAVVQKFSSSVKQMNNDNSEFRDIVERVCAGSDEATWELINTYGPHIQRVVRRKLNQRMRSKFDSLDFVQMVWASFFTEREKLSAFNEPNELIRYLATMAQRKLMQESRRRFVGQKHNLNRERALIAGSEDESTYVKKSNTPSQIVMAKDRLEAMMHERSDRDRQVVQLRLDGLTYVEIAAELQIHERTAREVIQKLALVETA